MDHFDKSARTLGGIFAALAATTFLAVATIAIAQTPPAATTPPKPAATKKPATQKPPPQTQQAPPAAQQQQAQQPPVVVPQLVYRRWTKVCPPKEQTNPTAGGKQPCFIFMEGREDMGALVVRATIMEVEGEAKKGLVVSFVYGVDLLRGTHIVVDQGPLEATAPYIVCVPPNVPPPLFGCVSQYEITGEVIAGLKKGKFLTLQTIFNGQTMSPQLPLAEFAKAYDGPPTDLKAEAELQQKMIDELKIRADKAAAGALKK